MKHLHFLTPSWVAWLLPSLWWRMHSRRCAAFPCPPPKKWAALIGQATAGAGLFSKHRGQCENVKSCTAAMQICVQGKVHVFLFTGEIFFSFLPFRLCVEGSSSSPICCLAKLTNTCNNENNINKVNPTWCIVWNNGGDHQGALCQLLM